LEDGEVVLPEVGDVALPCVGHGDVEVDDLDARAEYGRPRRGPRRLRVRAVARRQHAGQREDRPAQAPGAGQGRGTPTRPLAPGRATFTSTLRDFRPGTLS